MHNIHIYVYVMHAEFRIEHQALFWTVFRDAAEKAGSRLTTATATSSRSSIPDDAANGAEKATIERDDSKAVLGDAVKAGRGIALATQVWTRIPRTSYPEPRAAQLRKSGAGKVCKKKIAKTEKCEKTKNEMQNKIGKIPYFFGQTPTGQTDSGP